MYSIFYQPVILCWISSVSVVISPIFILNIGDLWSLLFVLFYFVVLFFGV